MKRLLIWYWSATGGGGSQYAVNLAYRLSKAFGAEAIRLSLHADDPVLSRAKAFAFETRIANVTTNRRRPLSTLVALGASARVLAEHARDCDAVLVPMNFASAAALAPGLERPLIYFAHDPKPHPGDYAAIGQRATQALLISRAVRVVALSDYAGHELEQLGVSKRKIVVAPLSAVFEPQPKDFPSAGPLRLLFAGRMLQYKGAELLADSLPALASVQNWRLTIAGEGPALDRDMRARLHSDNVEILPGWMSELELDALIADCDVLLAPYRSATQSGVVSQALAHGRPCIVTPVGALPEQIGNGLAGWVTQKVGAPYLSEVLLGVLQDEKSRAAKGRGAADLSKHAWAHDHWSWLNAK